MFMDWAENCGFGIERKILDEEIIPVQIFYSVDPNLFPKIS